MESHYFQEMLSFLRAHARLGELFTFIVAFAESLPIIGTIVPGSITMTVIGVLIGSGALPVFFSLLVASTGAFMGDSIGYFIGYYYNDRLRTMWPFKNHLKWLTMGEVFFKKHGGKSIILGRFIGPARSMVPLIAGLLRLSWLRFVVAAIPSAVLWAVMYMVPGILLGALSREIPKAETTRFFLYGIATLIIIWAAFWLVQHFFIQLTRLINSSTDKLWNYLSRKHGGRFVIRLLTNQQKPDDHHQLTLFFTAFLSGILFLFLLLNIRLNDAFIDFNHPLFHLLQSIRTPLWDKIFVVITIMGMPKTILFISILTALGLALKKQWRSATHLMVAFILSAGSVFIFKAISYSLRPQGFEWVSVSSSFPSGHTTLSFIIFSFMAFLLAQITSKNLRWIPYTFSSVLILLVGISRLYLGAHWFTDIMGSFLLGLSIVLFCIISYRRMPKKSGALHLKPFAAILIFCFSLAVPWCLNIARSYSTNLYDTTPVWTKQKINIFMWWQSPLKFTPLYRNNRFGKPFQPFNVQWEGSLQQITQTLENSDWKPISNDPKLKLKSTLQRFASHQAEYHIPLLPWLYREKLPVIFMIKHIPKHKRIIELRLWESDIHFQPGNKLLWLGATDIRTAPKVLMSIKEHATISLTGSGGLNELYAATQHFQRKIIRVTVDPNLKAIQSLKWNGEILLIRN